MRIPDCLTWRLARWAQRYMDRHPIAQVIDGGGKQSILILRWDIFDFPGFHVRLHKILGSDEMRALHDHPWWNVTVVLDGAYNEVMPISLRAGELTCRRRWAGDVVFRNALARHRILLDHAGFFPTDRPHFSPAISLFIHGRNKRVWGFWDDERTFTPAGTQRRKL